MSGWFADLNPIGQAFVANVGTYLLTAVGTVPVLFFKETPRRLMDALMGFAGGVMVAASCWSLLTPAIEVGGIVPAVLGLLIGGAALFALDKSLPHLHPEFPDEATAEGPPVAWKRSALLMIAITVHNFPEGLAVALPLRRDGMSRWKAFLYGQFSAAIEPVAGVLGNSSRVVRHEKDSRPRCAQGVAVCWTSSV